MTQQTLKSLHDDLSEALGQVQENGPVVLEYQGKPLAALICMEELRILEARIEELEDRIDREEAEKALAEIKEEGTVPWEQVRRELGIEDV